MKLHNKKEGSKTLDRNKIGDNLKKLRGERSMRDIAVELGITEASWSYYESGERIPRDELKMRIAELFNVSVSSIFFE